MTNGEKMQEIFPEGKTRKCRDGVVFESDGWCHAYDSDWWYAEYKVAITKNCESCKYYGSHHEVCKYCNECSLWTGVIMTREEAIAYGKRVIDLGLNDETQAFCELAIKALEQEPTTKNDLVVDCIDRNSIKYYPGQGGYMYASKGEIDKLPSVIPSSSVLDKNSKKLEKDFGESDCISRKAILDELEKWDWQELYLLIHFKQMLDELPSVTPQEPRKGHWILDEADNSITCDKCGCLIWANDISNGEAYYCPNCGADMREVEE